MSIQVQCTSCGKIYAADDNLAGRRIRCRECGTTFAIPAAESNEGDPDLSALAGPQEESGGGGSESTYAGRPPGLSPQSDSDESDREFVPSGRYRPRLNYPYAVVVDRWLPIFLLIGGLAWVIIAAVRYDETNKPALIISRILVLILAYLIVIFPMAAKGIQMASRDLGFQLPRAKYSRTLISFIPVFTLGSVLWMAGGTTGLILGVIVGLIVSCLAMWLLFHMHPAELPAATGYAGGMMVFGIAIVGGVLFGMNLLLSSALVSMHKIDSVPGSPFGVAFNWPKPAEPAPAPMPKKPRIASTPQPAPTSPSEATATPPVTQPVVVAQAPAAPDHQADSSSPATQNSGGMFGDALKDNDNSPAPVQQPDAVHQAAVAPPQTNSPLVDSVTMAPIQNQFDEIIRPVTPSYWAALLRKGNGLSEIDRVWIGQDDGPGGVKPWANAGSTPFVSDPKIPDRFALAPDGDLLAYITSFPALAVHLYSYEKKTQQNIKLQESYGIAEVLGFVSNTHLLVRREKDGRVGCELIDTRGEAPRDIPTQKFNCNNVSATVSPDGTMLAVASLDNQHPAPVPTIFLYDLSSGSPRKLSVSDLAGSPVTSPTSLVFSNDGTKIAALYEQPPNGLLVVFRTKNLMKPLISLPFNPVPAQPGNNFTGPSMIWVGDDALCLYGKSIVNASTGALVGDLGIPNVTSQRFTKPDLLELGLAGGSGDHPIAMVKVKMDQLAHP